MRCVLRGEATAAACLFWLASGESRLACESSTVSVDGAVGGVACNDVETGLDAGSALSINDCETNEGASAVDAADSCGGKVLDDNDDAVDADAGTDAGAGAGADVDADGKGLLENELDIVFADEADAYGFCAE